MTMFPIRQFAAALIIAVLVGTEAQAQSCPLAGQSPTLIVRMYFGQNIEGHRDIAPAAWRGFLAREVTERFPDGFTVFDATGQWRDPKTNVIGRERSKVIEIATSDTPDVRAKIEGIAARYRKLFHQQSVGIVTMPGCARF